MAEPHVKMSKWKTFGTGVGVGLLGSLTSQIFHSVFNTSLGYCPLGIKNLFKVGISAGLSTLAITAAYNKFKTMRKSGKKPDGG